MHVVQKLLVLRICYNCALNSVVLLAKYYKTSQMHRKMCDKYKNKRNYPDVKP